MMVVFHPKRISAWLELYETAIREGAEELTGFLDGDIKIEDIRLELECEERDYFVSPKLTKTMEKA